jgi:hypothetical protein
MSQLSAPYSGRNRADPDNPPVHLIVSFAAPLAEGARASLPSLATPALERLLADWGESLRDDADEDTLSMPHERALATALGWNAADGCLPWAARQAAADGIAVGSEPWGLLTPAHWRIGSDGVHLADPDALALSDEESRTLFEALQPLFASEAIALAWGGALRWYAAHASLQGLATASPDRVIGGNVDRWLPRQAEARRFRRLQNEAQMLLHAHPANAAREAAGALPVNSFWLSGCGMAQPQRADAVRLDERLRHPALRGDWAAWRDAWHALDTQTIPPLLAAAARGEPVRLTLCGECSAVELAPRAHGWWGRMIDSMRPARPGARALLESL